MLHPKVHPLAFYSKFLGDPIISGGESVRLDGTESLFRRASQRRARFLRVAPDHDFSAPRDEIQQPTKRQLIGLKIRINVGVVVLKRRHDQIVWMIVKKLWPTIPKCRLVF